MHCLCLLQPPFARRSLRVSIYNTLLLLFVVAYSVSASAQSTFGAFVGTVKDPQGAVIVGATVKLINLSKAAERETITGTDGQYSFLNVDAGTFKIEVTFSGFQKLQFPDLVLQARETLYETH